MAKAKKKKLPEYRFVTWDWKEEADIEAVVKYAVKGFKSVIFDMCDDFYYCIMTKKRLTDAQHDTILAKELGGDDDDE